MVQKRFLVIGVGKFGSIILKELHKLGHEVVGCDKDAAQLEKVQEFAEFVVIGDATDDAILDEIDVSEFDAVVVTLSDFFEAAILIVAKLKKRGCKYIIAECNDRFRGEILGNIVGANHIVYPEEESGLRLAKRLVMPGLKEFVEISPRYCGIEMEVPRVFYNKSLGELDLNKKFNVMILFINREDHHAPLVIPSAEEVLKPSDSIFVVGTIDDINSFHEQYSLIENRV